MYKLKSINGRVNGLLKTDLRYLQKDLRWKTVMMKMPF